MVARGAVARVGTVQTLEKVCSNIPGAPRRSLSTQVQNEPLTASVAPGPSSRPWTPIVARSLLEASASSSVQIKRQSLSLASQDGESKTVPRRSFDGFFNSERPELQSGKTLPEASELYSLLYPAKGTEAIDKNRVWATFVQLCAQSISGTFAVDALPGEVLHRVVLNLHLVSVSLLAKLSSRSVGVVDFDAAKDAGEEAARKGKGPAAVRPSTSTPQSADDQAAKARDARWKTSRTNTVLAASPLQNKVYAHCARFVLQQAKQTEYRTGKHPLPVHSYNAILEHAAVISDVNLLRDTWRQLRYTKDGPNPASYRYFMLGLQNHAKNIEKAIQRSEANKTFYQEELGKTALRAVRLVDQMLEKEILVDPSPLEWAARMIHKSGHLTWLKQFVRSCYAIDLDAPDSLTASCMKHHQFFPVTTHLLNTIIDAVGEHATVSEMIAVWEALSQPLPATEAFSAFEHGNPFKMDWNGLFRNDDGLKLPTSKPRNVVSSYANLCFKPNKFTFQRLLHHACFSAVNVESKQWADLPPIRKDECEARESGEYTAIAKYIIDDALGYYEAELHRVAQMLGLKLVPTLGNQTYERALEVVANKVSPSPSSADSVESPQDSSAVSDVTAKKLSLEAGQSWAIFSVQPLSDSEGPSTSQPILDPPFIQPGIQLFTALWRHAQKQRKAGTFAWLRERVSRASSLMRSELLFLAQAEHLWDAERCAQTLSPVADQPAVSVAERSEKISSHLKMRLRLQKKLVGEEVATLMLWDRTRLLPRLEFLRNQVAERQSRRRQTWIARTIPEEEARRLKEQRKVEARERGVQETAEWDGVTPAQLYAASQA